MALPTRTSSDPNASADINDLQAQISALSGGGGGGINQFDFKPGDLYFPSSSPAVLDTDTGTNGNIKRYLFDPSTDESLEGILTIPNTWSTSGTLSVELYGYPSSAEANDIVIDFLHSAVGAGESWDASYSTASETFTCSATADIIKKHTISIARSGLGWDADDQVRFKITRDADNPADTLTVDWGMTFFRVRW
jgi:hypothetical protein